MEKKLSCILQYAFLITITFPMLSSEAKQPMSLATDQTALLSLKQHITFDPSLLLATNWTNSSSVCSWIGVTCSLRHRRVAALNLSNMGLSGTIPPQLGHLSFLVSLDLTSNLFHGDLPQELSLLRRLKFISLRLNNFTGDIPPMFGQLPKLEYLNLGNNSFIGSIPKSISNLTNLRFLDLSSNSLSKEFPKEFGRLQSLQILYVQFNRLSGAIPSSIFNISTLVSMSFTYNELSGSLPTDMCSNLPFLAGIYLSYNQLSGTIPTNLSQCSGLEKLSLSYNSFSGEIPSEIGYLKSLHGLYLGGNNLNGILPREIDHLQSLVTFAAEGNQIAGSIDFNIFMNMDSFKGNEALCGILKFHVQICPSISNHRSKREKVKRASFIVFGVVAFILVVSFAFIIVRNKRKDKTTREVDELISIVPERISYYELLQATNKFDESNLLGTGSSCSVYKGILNNGKDIIVKVFNMQLEGISRIFDVECEILRSIRHRNLTSVISSCSNEEFKALVLEYMPKGNLEKWLDSHNYCLNMMERLNIMIDVASALEYLHHGYSMPIVHSDLKPSNVLLDEDMVAHVSDFGIAKLLCDGDSTVLTNTLATLGYIAPDEVSLNILIALHFQSISCVFLTAYFMIFVVPEYGSEGLVSTRCDVYSYGVMLIETFTRKKPTDDMFCGDMTLKRWVELSFSEIPDEVIDANLVMNLEEEMFEKNMQ